MQKYHEHRRIWVRWLNYHYSYFITEMTNRRLKMAWYILCLDVACFPAFANHKNAIADFLQLSQDICNATNNLPVIIGF